MSNEIYEKLEICRKSILQKMNFKPEVAVILGSGLGEYASKIKIEQIIPSNPAVVGRGRQCTIPITVCEFKVSISLLIFTILSFYMIIINSFQCCSAKQILCIHPILSF